MSFFNPHAQVCKRQPPCSGLHETSVSSTPMIRFAGDKYFFHPHATPMLRFAETNAGDKCFFNPHAQVWRRQMSHHPLCSGSQETIAIHPPCSGSQETNVYSSLMLRFTGDKCLFIPHAQVHRRQMFIHPPCSGGVAKFTRSEEWGCGFVLRKFQQAKTARVCTLALLLSDLEIDSSLLPSPIPIEDTLVVVVTSSDSWEGTRRR